jgi:hypothetical protein
MSRCAPDDSFVPYVQPLVRGSSIRTGTKLLKKRLRSQRARPLGIAGSCETRCQSPGLRLTYTAALRVRTPPALLGPTDENPLTWPGLPGVRGLRDRASLLQLGLRSCNPAVVLASRGAKHLQMAFAPFAVLRGQIRSASSGFAVLRGLVDQRRGRDSNPRTGDCPVSAFQERRIRPLCHPSGHHIL